MAFVAFCPEGHRRVGWRRHHWASWGDEGPCLAAFSLAAQGSIGCNFLDIVSADRRRRARGARCGSAHSGECRMDREVASNTVLDGTLDGTARRSEEHTSELQSLMRITYAVLCWKKKK